jgi:hypothetical protein
VTSRFLQKPQRIEVSVDFPIRLLKFAIRTAEFLPSVFVSLQDVPHEALAYALTKPLFVVVYRPVRSLVQEIIQETEQPWGKPIYLD